MPSTPARIWVSTSLLSASESRRPFLNGVTIAVCVPVNILNLDFAFKNKLSGPGQPNVLEARVGLVETDFEQVASLDLHFDRRTEIVDSCRNQGRSGDACAAGEGFSFDTTFERSNSNMV